MLTTRWHSCIESKKKKKQHLEIKDRTGNEMFQLFVLLIIKATASDITACINITVSSSIGSERQKRFLWLLPTHSFYFSEDLISVTLRGKTQRSSLNVSPFHNSHVWPHAQSLSESSAQLQSEICRTHQLKTTETSDSLTFWNS